MIRQLLFVLAAMAAFCARGSAALAADDFGPGFQFYEKEALVVLKAAGNKVWECADDARRQGFYAAAIEQAQSAIEYDPDQAEAREFLKYAKKDGKWVQDEAAYNDPAFPKKDQRASSKNGSETQESFEKRYKKWQDESLAKTNKYVAAKYAELGDICAAKGHADQAVKGYESAMRLDHDNEKARKGLGYTKFGKVWLTKKQDDARKAASKAAVVTTPEQDQWETTIATKMVKVESAHCRIESGFPVEECIEHCKAVETAYAYYLADFGKDPGEDVFSGGKLLFVVMNTDDQWNKFVDAYGGPDKEFTRKLMGCGVNDLVHGVRGGVATKETKNKDGDKEVQLGSSPESRRDMIVHETIHALNGRVWRIDSDSRAWLNEGLAYYYTLKTLESCLTHCVAEKKGDYANGHRDEGGMKKWDDPNGWKPLLKALVKKNNDTPFRSITMLPLTKLDYIDTVKSWSLATWLMDMDRAKFISCLDQMLDHAVKQENVIQGEYGKGYEELDDEWHKYVKKCY